MLKLKFPLQIFGSLLFGVLMFSCSTTKKAVAHTPPQPAVQIIPKPQVLTIAVGVYEVPKLSTVAFTATSQKTADVLITMLSSIGVNSDLKVNSEGGHFNLVQDVNLTQQLGEEGYTLDITTNGVTIKAAGETGLFYGIQTLSQLLPVGGEANEGRAAKVYLPQLNILDVPKYSWRGNMIDMARNFFDVDYLKAHMDRMALYKMNRLHLHLTDDQGWRLELKSKPLLSQIGGQSAVKGGRSGFLTTEDYKQLQAYAKERHIVIIPEIDLPGHIYAALVAYPELNCENFTNLNPKMATPPEFYDGYKVGWSKLCLTDPKVYEFVAEILQEVSELTEGPWVHIGGDEIDDDLYETFVVKADSMIRSYGKVPIGWEEMSKANGSETFISQRWNGKTTPKHPSKVIESICTSFYFDHANVTGQEKTNNWCQKSGVSLEGVYHFIDKEDEIIGVEAPVWTELVLTDAMLDNRLWPRLMAVAEIGWSASHDDFEDFTNRLRAHQSRLDALNIAYFTLPEPINK
ncbi:family 20 glycosylhydrolase [Gelidibacter salicanalis]|uniref:beta-N-acetylhexosaminidase n=1 Tax=Gelidibacter salicanalis TaxID=291193 RepID=A0A5C7ART3_9FLAO|nr:beta-N-acetylhexosaminidase [Gelidibacter salicanalis]TXE10734.1 family 20 glycosylhydrolase [Gelidibacter salicanalis]